MPLSHDTILLETVRTRRARLQSALLYGGLAQRRVVHDNVKRLVASLVVAAVACVGCIGFAVVTGLLAGRDTGGPSAVRPAPAATSPAAPAATGAPPGPTAGDRP